MTPTQLWATLHTVTLLGSIAPVALLFLLERCQLDVDEKKYWYR